MAHPHIILQEKHTVTSLSQLRQCLSTSSQPQCNKWVNGGAVPSSEADSRAFSFDIIPSSQIDNLTIVKDGKFKLQNVYFDGMDAVGTDANKQYGDYLYDAVQKKDIDKNQKSYSNTFFFAEQSNKYFDSWTSLVGADGYTPIAGSPLLGAASFAGWTGFDTVTYIGAFDGSNNWMSGWTNFDPQNAKY